MSGAKHETLVRIQVHCSWDALEEFCEYLNRHLQRQLPRFLAESYSMVSRELLETASRIGSPVRDVSYELRSGVRNVLEIEMSMGMTPLRATWLQQQVARLMKMDPQAAYPKTVEGLTPGRDEATLLSIARVRAERFDLHVASGSSGETVLRATESVR